MVLQQIMTDSCVNEKNEMFINNELMCDVLTVFVSLVTTDK